MALLSFFNLANEKLEVADKWLRDQVANLATVATTGSYNDLSDTPNIGNTDISGIGDGTITGSIDTINSNLSDLSSMLRYVQLPNSNDLGYISDVGNNGIGIYRFNDSTNSRPTGANHGVCMTYRMSSTYAVQFVFCVSNTQLYVRYKDTNWSAWRTI